MQIEALKVKLEQQAKQGAASQQLTDLQQALQAASDHDAEQAVAHAKEITQLTEAHTQLQNLVNSLTEENTRLDQANTTRSMHIGSLSAGLDQVKRTKSAKSGSGPDLSPEVSPVEAPVDDRSAELSSELADLQRKQSSRNLQVCRLQPAACQHGYSNFCNNMVLSDIHRLSISHTYQVAQSKSAWRAQTCSTRTQPWLASVLITIMIDFCNVS